MRRIFASTTLTNVPSEPTISRATLSLPFVAWRRPVPGILRLDLIRVRVADADDFPVDLAFEPGEPALGRELVRGHLAEHGARAVGEHRGELDHVLDRETVRDRVRAARVVTEHAAERRAVRRRGVRAEAEPERAHVVVQVVL